MKLFEAVSNIRTAKIVNEAGYDIEKVKTLLLKNDKYLKLFAKEYSKNTGLKVVVRTNSILEVSLTNINVTLFMLTIKPEISKNSVKLVISTPISRDWYSIDVKLRNVAMKIMKRVNDTLITDINKL